MDHYFQTKIVKGKKERVCFGCYGKIEIGEKQEVRRGVYDGEFVEDRVCMKCSRLIHREEVANDDGEIHRGVIKELIEELELETHEELEFYFDNK